MRRSSRKLTWLVPFFVLALPSAAAAADVSAADHEAAVTNFQAGRRFVEQGNCKEAIPRFLESLRHEQSVGARLNLAECSRAEQRTTEAWNQFKVAEQIAIQKGDAERRDAAQKAIAELEPKVFKIRMTLPTDARDLVVKIDGRVVADVDYPLLGTSYAVEPGQAHRIDVTAKNRAPWSKAGVQGAAGAEQAAIVVDLGGPLEPEGADVGSKQRTMGLVVGGVGVAGVIVGGVFGLLASGAKSSAKDACGPGYPSNCTNTDGTAAAPKNSVAEDKTSSAKTDATISTIGFIAGAALVAGGAVLYFTAPKSTGKEAARLHVSPAVGPGMAGAMLGGSF